MVNEYAIYNYTVRFKGTRQLNSSHKFLLQFVTQMTKFLQLIYGN